MLVFLSTDFKGSTGLWERRTGVMTAINARHDDPLREKTEGHGGRITKYTGGGITAASEGGEPLACSHGAQVRFSQGPRGHVIIDTCVSLCRINHSGMPVTWSAATLVGVEAVAKAVDSLAQVLKGSRGTMGLLSGAVRSAQTFTDRDYIDLAHFCRLLAEGNPDGGIGLAVQLVVDLLIGETSPLVAKRHHGSAVADACGLSIYLPAHVLSPLYSQRQFAEKYRWDELLDAFIHPR